ncbi:hypothetical protein [Paracoccus kondratievae]|uniref:Integrase SAM-like N-terminal domain-containing protein n=1 Tax=Paracoccus kondratievae TaxID=135740 RepID=A0AAD3RTC6_9RHOB|nr:hypothetical protein [Paracoccus kondratievae]GLK63646.1 hypothetical protein GCM10017635_11160 [Paracoccus kondratievae]
MARTEAMKYLSDVRLGADPAGERDRRKASPTMKEFGKRFLADHVALHCKASTYGEYERSINLFINPKFGSHRIIDITRADVVGLHQSMKHIPYQANRTLGVLSVMFTVAHTWGVCTDGPFRQTRLCGDRLCRPPRGQSRYRSGRRHGASR